jgi:methylmalonyl-CoA mutase
MSPEPAQNPVRFVTAASLFDGHDAAINIMRRILQSQGAEVIHLGHDRSVDQIVRAAISEDAHAVAVSSYQGGHVEYFTYLADQLAEQGAGHIKIFGGGGGVIVPEEIALLALRGIRIFSPEDGQRLGLDGMIAEMISAARADLGATPAHLDALISGDVPALARTITMLENDQASSEFLAGMAAAATHAVAPVLGITGTGGSGKSSLTDELLLRFRQEYEGKLRVAVIAIDPTRRRAGGALLGDRIRMNSVDFDSIYFRSLATRDSDSEIPQNLARIVDACRAASYDLIIVETPGIGQGSAGVVPFVDASLYVMTPEYGAASQLEKIDMLDFADVVAINKYERRGAEDARRDVGRQLVRNRQAFTSTWEDMPVFGTSAARFNDDGLTALYVCLRDVLVDRGMRAPDQPWPESIAKASSNLRTIVPPARERYLSEISTAVRGHHAHTEQQASIAARVQHLESAAKDLEPESASAATAKAHVLRGSLDNEYFEQLTAWPAVRAEYEAAELVTTVRDRELRAPLQRTSLSGTQIPRVSLPQTDSHADLVRYFGKENLPGRFPFTAGVFPLKRDGEAPARMFAGEGDCERTNRRFHLLAEGQPATRLSTAFDSVTLYGRDPDLRPDIYGKVGTSGVSIATLDDMRGLFAGFDLCDPKTSVSMTINGPAPTILAMYLNAAIDQQVELFVARERRSPSDDEAQDIQAHVFTTIRGTVQADILKEDQGQNTCIFSTEFALRCMSDVQEWFIENRVRNFYSVSISGYHIAEAGANPISQLAFTLSNAFTYVEAYRARGMDVNDFAPSFSFFFSNGMDPEYTVIGRVARRIWAIAMRDLYGADDRAQRLKYHVQTSGRSLHAQEMAFNDIRTTLQALCALYDNANSLHTNAYDEAVTTPSPASVRRALAIQMIIDQEWGLSSNENPLQGSYIVDYLTDALEEAVLTEFDRISERGGVLGAMETGYQRGRIQDESMLYEHRKHDGSLPIIGVNTFIDPHSGEEEQGSIALARATEQEKESQLSRLARFQGQDPLETQRQLQRLKETARAGGNVFGVLMDAVRHCSLGQISEAFFEVGGKYRRGV